MTEVPSLFTIRERCTNIMKTKKSTKWNVWAVVDNRPIGRQNAAPLVRPNAERMAGRLEKTGAGRVTLVRAN